MEENYPYNEKEIDRICEDIEAREQMRGELENMGIGTKEDGPVEVDYYGTA